MNEQFLHYLWQHKYFFLPNLTTTSGEMLTILNTGIHNLDGGPDFLNAKLRIGELEWAGNVEIHLKASDWIKHQHQINEAYDNIILHVVYDADVQIFRKSGDGIPTFQIKGHFNEAMYDTFQEMETSNRWIACEKQISTVPRITFELWLERLLIERLEEKTTLLDVHLQQNQFDWEQSFFESVASSFGLKVNSMAFELLAKATPLSLLQKHADNLFQIEALLFGQSGLLDDSYDDDYPNLLWKEYQFLQTKYALIPIDKAVWNFLRLRPSSFPTHRIAQLAQLVYQNKSLFSKAVVSINITSLFALFQVDTSEYWHSHYLFDKKSKVNGHKLGITMVNLIVINSVIPYLFLYGKHYGKESYTKKALDLHDLLPSEDNLIIRGFKSLNINTTTAFRSQSLLQLKKKYCDHKKCLDCAIGNHLIKC